MFHDIQKKMLSFFLLAESTIGSTVAPTPEPSLDFSWLFIKVVLAMIVVCVVAYLGIKYLLPKASFIKKSNRSEIEVLERFPLEPKKNLYILKVENRRILVGTTENSVNSLLELGEKGLNRDHEIS